MDKKPMKVDLTKEDPRSFSHYIAENLKHLGNKTAEELIQFIKDGAKTSPKSGSNASDKYIEGILSNIEERNMNARQILKYISDIMLAGAGMSVIKPKSNTNEQIIKSIVASYLN
jgi:hypothetical protein